MLAILVKSRADKRTMFYFYRSYLSLIKDPGSQERYGKINAGIVIDM